MAKIDEKQLTEQLLKEELRTFHEENGILFGVLSEENDLFRMMDEIFRSGKATVELKKRFLLRAIDEAWVNAIEDTLPYLDTAIRNPFKFIIDREEVLPIEMSKNISPQSLKHLAQHTDFISKVEGDKVTPSKLLNVFKEETLQTYENKFLNTLIRNLIAFVSLRYDVAKKQGQDTKETTLSMEQEFSHGHVKGKMNFSVQIMEPPEDEDYNERNYTKTTELWKRVERINEIVRSYGSSEFVREMGQSYVRPPITKTNALLKNPNLVRCLALYQFIESYEQAGYSMLVTEDLENVPESYLTELYRGFAAQYLNFRYNIDSDFRAEDALDTQMSEDIFRPKVIKKLKALREEEFAVTVEEEAETPEEAAARKSELALALQVSLEASRIMLAANPEESLAHGDIPEPEPVQEYVDEMPEETPEEKAEETPEEAPEEKVEEKPEETAEETSEETPEEKPEETAEEAPEETPEETAEEQPEEKRQEGGRKVAIVGESLALKRRRAEQRRRKRYIEHQRNRGVSKEEIEKKLNE